MKITVLTLFPKMIESFIKESILSRAQKDGKIEIELIDLRNYGLGKHKQVDDTPYGGGAGMVLKVDVLAPAILDLKKKLTAKDKRPVTILLTPQGEKYGQNKAQLLADDMVNENCNLILICGHYEGFDERIRDYVDEEISIGDYILTGGEIAAAAIIDSVSRLIPGVLGKIESADKDSFSSSLVTGHSLLEHPHYTRPEEFEGKKVPEVLLSGNHAKIEKWRNDESLKRTKSKRPDLLKEEK